MEPDKVLCHILTPVGMLGYSFDVQEVHSTLERIAGKDVPVALILDSGSTDSGPQKLATNSMSCPRAAYTRDLRRLLQAVKQHRVPLLIGSAGGAGTNAHVDTIAEIVSQEGQALDLPLKILKIYSEIPKSLVTKKLGAGQIEGCGSVVPPLQQADIDDCPRIVAQMGPEPYLQAMTEHDDFDVIVGGRAYDPAPYVAFITACRRKLDRHYTTDIVLDGASMHLGKIMECGGLCASPKSHGALVTMYVDGSFDLTPTAPAAKCTPLSVAAHTLYEKSRPDLLFGPGGWLDLTESIYTQNPDQRSTRVRGSRFFTSQSQGKSYQIKLEAARVKGFRTIYMGRHVDPILTSQIRTLLPLIKQAIRSRIDNIDQHYWDIDWHIHGVEENQKVTGSVFLVGECIADTQDLANSIAALARTASIHASYPGQKATSGNFAFGIAGTSEIALGPCSEFCIYHLMDVDMDEAVALFPIHVLRNDVEGNHSGTVTDNPEGHHLTKNSGSSSRQISQSSLASMYLPATGTLGAIASVVRSKNAGPYEITLDIMFDDVAIYQRVKQSERLTPELISELYNLKPADIIWSGFFDQALAYKATIPRVRNGVPRSGGGFMEDDIHGSQMYMPLMNLAFPMI